MMKQLNLIKIAINWWHNELSFNEQKYYAYKHLGNCYYPLLLIGDYAQWVKWNYHQILVLNVWFKEFIKIKLKS